MRDEAFLHCVVLENTHTPPTEDSLICTPPPPRIFHSKGVFDDPPSPQEFPEFLNRDFFTSKWFWYFKKNRMWILTHLQKIRMVEFYYNNFNFCEGYYWPKLLATLWSDLQIMSVLFSCKLISLNIWVTKFKTSIVLRFCAYSDANIMKRTLLSLT